MSEIIVAALGLVGTLTGSMLAGKLTQYRLKALEDKVDKHNRLIERTYVLEGQMTEMQAGALFAGGGGAGTAVSGQR